MVKYLKTNHDIDFHLKGFQKWIEIQDNSVHQAKKQQNAKGKGKGKGKGKKSEHPLAQTILLIEKHTEGFVNNAIKLGHTHENESRIANFHERAQALLGHVRKSIVHPGKFADIKENLQSLDATLQEGFTKLSTQFKGQFSFSTDNRPTLTTLRNTQHLSNESSLKATQSRQGNTFKQQVTKRQNIP